MLTLWLPVTYCAGHNTDLALKRNISKTVRVFGKVSNDIQVDRLCPCGSLVIDV